MAEKTIQYLPQSHIESLKNLEREYWWCRGRAYWAHQLIAHSFPDKRIGVYADVGCGTGIFAETVSEHFTVGRSYWVDGDASFPQGRGGEFLVQNLEEGLHLPQPADLITLMDVLEHLRDDEKMLGLLHSQLKSGGILLLTVPAVPGFFSDWDRKLGHYRRYWKKDLKQKLIRAQFEVLEAQYMWSFLSPMGYVRKLQKQGETTEFPKTSAWMNAALVMASKAEYALTRAVPTPIGTSLLFVARKMPMHT